MELLWYVIFAVIILICISVHEYAHAKVADILGDPTPRLAGRLTLNPINHIDPIGFLMLLIVRIGWAKPVPINPYNFKNPQRGMAITGAAGPVSNFILAWILAIILKTLPMTYLWYSIMQYAIYINLALMVFNLLPIPPLDGSRIFAPFIPERIYMNLERYSLFIMLGILFFGFPLIRSLIMFFYNILV